MWALIIIGGSLGLILASCAATAVGRRLLATAIIGFKRGLVWFLDLTQLRRVWAKLRGVRYERLTRPQVLRLSFEDLGPTYIKFGQIIASSPGLFTDAYVREFRKCLDSVRPISFQTARQVIEEDLGGKASELILDERPLASASIAQVHAARTRDGREVVVKVQRPGISKRVISDVKIMRFWARVAAAASYTVRLANPVGVVDDFGKTIREELDFTKEAKNLDEFNRIMKELDHLQVCAPAVHWELTTPRVLTMERFYGHMVDDIPAIKASSVNPEEKLLVGLRAWFQCVMFYGLFHGDVHAGNLMWLADGRIGFLDFGIVGRFNDLQRRLVTRYIMAFATGQFRELAEVVVEMGGVDQTVDVDAFAEDLKKAYSPLLTLSFGEMNYGDLLPNILAMARKHGARLPNEFILIVKQLLYFDRYAKLLAPKLNVFTDPRVFTALAQDIQLALSLNPANAGHAGAKVPAMRQSAPS
jgi:predicted unusual protein kinase regulating ubiquinone biosynthesis (AarF/ABC1/UbiB family)